MRLFVAIRLPVECRSAVQNAARPLDGAMGARLLEPENWHLTVRFIGEADEAGAKKIAEALAGVKFAPFQVKLFGAGAYPSHSVPCAIWIGGESQGAAGLAEKVEGALAFLGGGPERFSVHLTVARSKGIAAIGEFVQKTGEVCGFEAKSFCLMKSTLGAQGASYEVLREYPAQP